MVGKSSATRLALAVTGGLLICHPGEEDLIQRSSAKRCVSKDEAIEVEIAQLEYN